LLTARLFFIFNKIFYIALPGGRASTARKAIMKNRHDSDPYRLLSIFLKWSTPYIIILLLAQPVRAQNASIEDIIVNNSNTSLLLYLSVRNAFMPDMIKGVQNGIPASFTYYVKLEQIRQGWLDREVVAHSFTRTLTFDNLKEDYHVIFGDKKDKEVITKSLDEAQTLMTELNGFEVVPLKEITRDSHYVLKVKAGLAKKTLPLYFHYLIPFWRLWDFETDWYVVEFRY